MEIPLDTYPVGVLHEPSAAVRAAKDIAFGSAAGIASKFFEHPFDLCKVRLQAQVLDSTARFRGPVDCLRQTWTNEGVRGLYRGLPAPIVGAMAENATLFLSYNELSRVMKIAKGKDVGAPMSTAEVALAAGGAGAMTSFVLTPIELVKCKMQVQMLVGAPSVAGSGAASASAVRSTLPGPFSIVASVLRTDGLSGLWLGQTGTLLRETFGGAAWFTTKELVVSYLVNRRLSSTSPAHALTTTAEREPKGWESAVGGACAGAAYNLILFPADTVKSAMQTEAELRPQQARAGGSRTRPTFFGTAREMWARQGAKGLYAGCGVTVARAIPSSALIFVIYDGLRARFG